MQAIAGTSLSSRAMLADLNIRQWTASKHDKSVTHEVAKAHNADASMGRYSKHLVAKEALKDVTSIAMAARLEHMRFTLPWCDRGARILNSSLYFDYKQAMEGYKQKWTIAVSIFCANYDDYVLEAQKSLGSLFNAADYPPSYRIMDRFGFNTAILPFPSPESVSEDLRVSIGEDEVREIQKGVEQQVNEALECAILDVVERIRDTVSHMADKLKAFKVEIDASGKQKTEGIFRDSLVENVRELAAILPALNITGSKKIEQVGILLNAQLCKYAPDTLRESASARIEVADAADNILSKLGGII